MKYALIIVGILAAVALTAPTLVVAGYFLLIVPGLVLTVAPTVFVYLAATAVIRRLLPIATSIAGTVVAFGVAILLGWAVMQPFRAAAFTAYNADSLPDVIDEHAIELDGHVRLEMPNRRGAPECDYLCLAVLDSDHVQSVTSVTAGRTKQDDGGQTAAYALVSAKANAPTGLFPNEPGRIVRAYPPLLQSHRGRGLIEAAKAVEANWAMRLAGRERLIKVAPVGSDAADWVLRIESQSNHQTSTLRRITIRDRSGTVRFRKSYRKQAVPAHLFYFGFRTHCGGGTISGASFHVGRQLLESGQRSLKPERTLLTAIDLEAPGCDAETLALLRDQAIQALDDPAATAARLDLARRFLGLFFFDATESDHALIVRIVADDRVKEIDDQIKNVFSKHKTPQAMQEAYAKRIVMDHTSASLRHWLAERLSNLPPGTFAEPTAEHIRIWNTPEIYRQAAPFIATLADLGPERAIPALEAALDSALELPNWRERRPLVDSICEALIRLGPRASSVVPRIRELFLRRPSPILANSKDADQWRFTLARMGVPVEQLPVFPSQSTHSIERISRRISDKLQRYEEDHAQRTES
ncbi:MAG: hypothetical protein HKN47_09830 [Pirellulaceae bacterium]|nr:hypothetical protein [Pirellulaceae bacterium]